MDSSSPPPPPQQQQQQQEEDDENYSFNPNTNWLAFSLTPNPNPNLNPNPSPLSLFHPHLTFFPPPPGNNFLHEQDGATGGTVMGGATSDYNTAALGTEGRGGPKLEDFLGGSGMEYPGGPGQDTATAFYGAAEAKAVEGMHGLMTSAADEYAAIPTKQQTLLVFSSAASEPLPPLPPPAAKKGADTFGHRTSIYRGVTRHRWTGRYEAHLWDNSCKREGQTRKGRQGGYDKEERAARAYDLAALKYWGPTTTTNFPISDYEKELEVMKDMARQEFVASLRRKSSGFSRGASIYRGVTRHHQHGRWQARIGRVAGNKDLYLGTFSTQEEAAEAYDIAAIKFRGASAVTNFDISRYDVKSIASSNLPVSGLTNKPSSSKATVSSIPSPNVASGTIPFHITGLHDHYLSPSSSSTTLSFAAIPIEQTTSNPHMISWSSQDRDLATTSEFGPTTDPPFMEASSGSSLGFYDQGVVASEFGTATDVDDGGGGRGYVGSELHSYRDAAAKANLSALHTLIFGME